MSYLLDTQVLLWWLDDPKLLSNRTRQILEDPSNIVYVSSVSTWEIVIKQSLGKLKVPKKIFEVIFEADFLELPVSIEHTQQLTSLPDYHKDPFDRLLIAQAIAEKMTIITSDKTLSRYPITIIPA